MGIAMPLWQMRSVVLAAGALSLAAPAGVGAQETFLTAKPGLAGCLSDSVSDGCDVVRPLAGASSVATSPDGSTVYVSTLGGPDRWSCSTGRPTGR